MNRVAILAVIIAAVMVFSGMALAAETEHLISFQGQALDDAGDPVATGSLQVRIYNVATGGTEVYDSDQDFVSAIQDGIFDVLLGSGAVALNLDNAVKYYLEVSINGEEVVGDSRPEGRQEFWPGSGDHTHMHDADYVNVGESNSVTGGMIIGNSIDSAKVVDNSITASDLAGTACSDICTDANTTDCTSCDSRFVISEDLDHLDASDGSPTSAVYVDAYGNVGIGTTTPSSKLSVGGNGYMNTGVYGYGNDYGVYGDGLVGVYGNGPSSGVAGFGGIMGVSGTGTDLGVYGNGDSYGGYFANYSSSGDDYGVYGSSTGGGTTNYGGKFEATGATTSNYGGHFTASGATTNYGVYADGTAYGGYFTNGNNSGDDYGVYGRANGSGGTTHYGGKFEATGATTNNYGGHFTASGATTNYGVYADGTAYGGYFTNGNNSGDDYGVFGRANGSGGGNHYGGRFEASNGSGTDYGVYATGEYGVYATGTYNGGSFQSTSAGIGVEGMALGSGAGNNIGGNFGAQNGGTNYGVYSQGQNYGVYGYGFGTGSTGVYGWGTTCDFDAMPGGATNYCNSSSIRWKQNISEIDCALDKVASLQGVYFDWIEEYGGSHDIGMVAEEVGKVVPEVVAYEPDGMYARAIDYAKLTPLLVQAIKEQNKIIAQLKELVCLDHPDAEVCAQ